MEEKYGYSAAPKVVRGNRKTGRPRVEITEQPGEELRLWHFPGTTKREKLEQLYDLWFNCQKCELGQLLRADGGNEDLVFADGNPDADIMIIGEAPGAQEEETKIPFVGAAGQLLDMLLATVSDDPDVQEKSNWYSRVEHNAANTAEFHRVVQTWRTGEFFITNAVCCQPPDNRSPSVIELKACWERLWNTIYIVDPLLIIVCGNTALATVTRKPSALITKSRGQIFDVTYDGKVAKLTYPVMPIFHPSYLGRVADWKNPSGTWAKTKADLKQAMKLVDFLRHEFYGTPYPER